MSIGLLLKARVKPTLFGKMTGKSQSPEKLLADLDKWILEYCTELRPINFIGTRDDKPTLFCRLHPAAEDLELSVTGPNEFTASANTSTVGPGYHIFVCDMLHKLGKHFNAVWEDPSDDFVDEAGYFHSGNQDQVFAEMSTWLKAVAGAFFDGTLTDHHSIRLAMPVDAGFEADERAVTPLGPRDLDWLKKTAADTSNGRDFFAWWSPGLNADYFLGRALARMWSDVRWRKPINDIEREMLKYVSGSLETAYKLDSDLNYPWAEWTEILGYLQDDDTELDFVRQHAKNVVPKIGYRRRDVSVQLPGFWWITLPGSFSEFREQDDALLSQDPPREVWYSGYRFGDDPKASFAHWRSETVKMSKEFVEESEGYIAEAQISQRRTDGGKEYFALTSSNICSTGRCICTIVFTDPEDREWAIKTWKSLKPPAGETSFPQADNLVNPK